MLRILSIFGLLALFFSSIVLSEDLQNLSQRVNTNGFEPNMGQVGNFKGEKVNDVLFFVKNNGFDVYIKANGVSYVIRNLERNQRNPEGPKDLREKPLSNENLAPDKHLPYAGNIGRIQN